MVDTLLWFLVSLVVAFGVTGGIIGGFASGKMQPSLSGWAVGWIAGFFGMAAVAIFPAIADMGKHPHAKDWLWIIARGIVGWYLISKGREYLTIKKSYRVIPNDPEALFMVSIWDTVINCVKRAGKKFLPNWWPFFISGVEISLANNNMDGTASNISTVDAGVVLDRVDYSITYAVDPNPDRALLFLTNQRTSGVNDQMEDMVLQAFKDAFGKLLWQDATKGSDNVRQEVVQSLTGQKDLPSPDSRNLGIRIVTFSIKNVTSSMAEQAQKKEAKKLEAEGKMIEIEGVSKRIKILVDTGIPEEDARIMVSTRDLPNVLQTYITFKGLQQEGGVTADDVIDMLEAMGVEVDEEKKEKIEEKFPNYSKSQNQGTMGKNGKMFWLAEFMETFGVPIPKHKQPETQSADEETQGDKPTQGQDKGQSKDEKKPPTMTKEESEKRRREYFENRKK